MTTKIAQIGSIVKRKTIVLLALSALTLLFAMELPAWRVSAGNTKNLAPIHASLVARFESRGVDASGGGVAGGMVEPHAQRLSPSLVSAMITRLSGMQELSGLVLEGGVFFLLGGVWLKRARRIGSSG